MAWVKLEAIAEKIPGYVTMDQVHNLIHEAEGMNAPPNAEFGVDLIMEFRTPARARKVTITWER